MIAPNLLAFLNLLEALLPKTPKPPYGSSTGRGFDLRVTSGYLAVK